MLLRGRPFQGMLEPNFHLACAPRGPGVMLALFYFADGADESAAVLA